MSTRLQACIAALGGVMTGPMRASVPGPNHGRHDRSLSLLDTGSRIVWHGFSDRNTDQEIAKYLAVHGLIPTSGKQRPLTLREKRRIAELNARHEEERIKRAAGVWNNSGPSDISRRYLSARGISEATTALACRRGGSIREYRDERARVAMVVVARNARGTGRAVQLTKLKADGSGKRGEALDRITYGVLRGAAVQLLTPTVDVLAICEGVEDALAFYDLHRIPAWAALGASNLQQFEPPQGVKRLFIAADGDATGQAAAGKLFENLRPRLRCTMALAPEGMDWADVLVSRRRESVG